MQTFDYAFVERYVVGTKAFLVSPSDYDGGKRPQYCNWKDNSLIQELFSLLFQELPVLRSISVWATAVGQSIGEQV